MTVPRLAGVDFGGPPDAAALVLGPSLGTSSSMLWDSVAQRLRGHVRMFAWDLPGHGYSAPASQRFSVAELCAAVAALAEDLIPGETFHYVGNSIGGAVGLQLLLDHSELVSSATLICTGASIGAPAEWQDRAHTIRESGLATVAAAAAQRWFAEGFVSHHPEVAGQLVDALPSVDAESYALACEALAEFDVADRLAEITTPVLAVAGARDVATPPNGLNRVASGVNNGRLVVVDGTGHLPPVEAPDQLANLIFAHVAASAGTATFNAGMRVRRQVLGDAHVDRAMAETTEFSRDFQELITRYAWGSIWTRPGLDRRSRSLITLTALVARGHHAELAMHLHAARRNGLTDEEISELLLQTAIYCGVPEANSAFRIANEVLSTAPKNR